MKTSFLNHYILFIKSLMAARPSLLALLATMASIGCAPETPKLQPAPPVFAEKAADGGDVQIEFNPQVDILFVLDNSGSMRDHQTRLAANVDKFIEAFGRDELIDYHVGIVSVSDSFRQNPEAPHYWQPGRLRPLTSPDAPAFSKLVDPKRPNYCRSTDRIVEFTEQLQAGALNNPADLENYVSRKTPRGLETLRASLKIGTQCVEHNGPEFEELFNPIDQAFSDALLQTHNKGFYRSSAHLAVIIVSDADASNRDIKPSSLIHKLNKLKGQEGLLSTHAIGIAKGDQCPRDPSIKVTAQDRFPEATELRSFVKGTGGRFMSLCDADWGKKLADLGIDIRARVLKRAVRLANKPEAGSIRVDYGTQVISQATETTPGWTYNGDTWTVILGGDIPYENQPGARLRIRYTPIYFSSPSKTNRD